MGMTEAESHEGGQLPINHCQEDEQTISNIFQEYKKGDHYFHVLFPAI